MKLKLIMQMLLIGSVAYLSVIEVRSEEPRSDEVIKVCSEALDACGTYAESLEVVIEAQNIALDLAKKEQVRLKRQRDSIFRNPFVWGAAGLLLGVVITR